VFILYVLCKERTGFYSISKSVDALPHNSNKLNSNFGLEDARNMLSCK